jgi:hypothetical protein
MRGRSRCGIISGVDDLHRARTVVEDHCGEGPIAFPELEESLRRGLSVPNAAAVELARAVLKEFLSAGRIRIHRGRALDPELPEATVEEARHLIEDRAAYHYGDGDEARAWFSLDC